MATDDCIVIEWMYVCYKKYENKQKSGILPPNLKKKDVTPASLFAGFAPATFYLVL
jgi:hypothetical protein